MKLLNVEIKVDTFKNVVELFWHGSQYLRDMKIGGIEEGFDLGIFEKQNDKTVKPISLTQKGYVMARAHFFIERTSLLELESALFEARVRLTESYENDKDLVPHNFDKELESSQDQYNADRDEDGEFIKLEPTPSVPFPAEIKIDKYEDEKDG